MPTPKDEVFKQRQAEFRKLNKGFYSAKRLSLDDTGYPKLTAIVHKDVYHGKKTGV